MGFSEDPLYQQILQVTATITSIIVYLSGIPICCDIRRRKSTDDITSFPFVIGLLSTSFRLRYSILKNDISPIIVNIVGSLLMFCYLVFYAVYTKRRLCIIIQICADLVFIAIMSVLVQIFESDYIDIAALVLGCICIVLKVLMVGSPLVKIVDVIRNHCTGTLPLPLCVANLLVSIQWAAFGIFRDDYLIVIPNGIGILLASFQVSLFLVYPISQDKVSPLGHCCKCCRFDDIEKEKHEKPDKLELEIEAAGIAEQQGASQEEEKGGLISSIDSLLPRSSLRALDIQSISMSFTSM